MRAHHVLPFLLAVPACAEALGQTDGFGQKLLQGCSTQQQCDQLVAEAQARDFHCKDNEIGKLRCSDTHADLLQSRELAKAARGQSSDAVSAQQAHRELADANKRIAELERQLSEAKVKQECSYQPLHVPNPDTVEELRECRVTLESLGAENEVLKAARDKAQAACAARSAAPRAPAPAPVQQAPTGGGGRLQCCDGSLSPSCSCGGSHRGCCSHHGGVCGCN